MKQGTCLLIKDRGGFHDDATQYHTHYLYNRDSVMQIQLKVTAARNKS
jgi:hypothetical protein